MKAGEAELHGVCLIRVPLCLLIDVRVCVCLCVYRASEVIYYDLCPYTKFVSVVKWKIIRNSEKVKLKFSHQNCKNIEINRNKYSSLHQKSLQNQIVVIIEMNGTR